MAFLNDFLALLEDLAIGFTPSDTDLPKTTGCIVAFLITGAMLGIFILGIILVLGGFK